MANVFLETKLSVKIETPRFYSVLLSLDGVHLKIGGAFLVVVSARGLEYDNIKTIFRFSRSMVYRERFELQLWD